MYKFCRCPSEGATIAGKPTSLGGPVVFHPHRPHKHRRRRNEPAPLPKPYQTIYVMMVLLPTRLLQGFPPITRSKLPILLIYASILLDVSAFTSLISIKVLIYVWLWSHQLFRIMHPSDLRLLYWNNSVHAYGEVRWPVLKWHILYITSFPGEGTEVIRIHKLW
jgi:hypothetical protein